MFDDRGLGAIESEGFVGDTGVPVGGPSEKADGTRIEGEQLEAVLPGRDFVGSETGAQFAIGGNLVDALFVVVEFQRSAAGRSEERRVGKECRSLAVPRR